MAFGCYKRSVSFLHTLLKLPQFLWNVVITVFVTAKNSFNFCLPQKQKFF